MNLCHTLWNHYLKLWYIGATNPITMPQSLTSVYVHLVFSTKYREPIIDDEIKNELYTYLGGICKHLECHPVKIGGYYDHIHILCALSKKITMMKLL